VVTLKSIAISFVSLSILVATLMLVIVISTAGYASAQSIPLPPPSFEESPEETRVAKNDRSPPEIEILTTELAAGKNVFRVRITDDSSLQVREVKYVSNGQLKVDGLFRDQNDMYKALVDIQPPSRIVVVTASDASGNMATAYREYDVKKSGDLFTQIMEMFSQIPRYFQHLFDALAPE
jgi:hypothetical protein